MTDHTAMEKAPTPGVDTRITTSFVTGVPMNTPANLPSVDEPGSGDASVAPAGRLAGVAAGIAASSSNLMVAPSHVPAFINPVTDVKPAVATPTQIAAVDIPVSISPSPAVVNSHTVVAGAPLPTLVVPPAASSAFVAEAVALTYNGQKVSINPSEFIAPSATIALTAHSQVVVYQGQSLTLEPSQLVAAGTAIPFTAAAASPTLLAATVGSITFSLGPSAAVIGSSTYLFSLGEPPLTKVVDGQTIRIGANGIGFAGTTVAIPTGQAFPTLSTVVADGLKINVGSNKAIVNDVTYAIGSGATPQTVVIGTETLSFGPGGVGLPSTTILPFYAPKVPSPVVVDGLTLSIDATQAVISGTTYAIGPGSAPKTVVIGTETISIGPGGVGLPSTTVLPFYPPTVPSPVVVDGLTFSIDATQAVISGTTYAIGPGSAPKTVVVGTETVILGPGGVGLPLTTLVPPSLPSIAPTPVIADGLTFSIEPTEVIIGGSTYAIGSGASTETLVIAGETVVIGPGGVDLPSTTITPPGLPLITPTPVTVDGLTFSIEPTEVIIDGSTYAIGRGAPTETLVISGETVLIGPGGVILPSTTIAPPGLSSITPTPVIADGLTFSIEPTEVLIGGSTYAIGSGAPTETLVIAGETVVIGPGGVSLPSTTIAAPGSSSTGFDFFATGAASSSRPALCLIGSLVCFSLGVLILL